MILDTDLEYSIHDAGKWSTARIACNLEDVKSPFVQILQFLKNELTRINKMQKEN